MNTRIQQLIKECTYQVCDSNRTYYDKFDKEKFAEMIVRECADSADMAYDARCKYPGDYVAEQFGYGEVGGVSTWRSGVKNERS